MITAYILFCCSFHETSNFQRHLGLQKTSRLSKSDPDGPNLYLNGSYKDDSGASAIHVGPTRVLFIDPNLLICNFNLLF